MARKVVRNPGIMLGKPTFEGTRITVEVVLELLAEGATVADVVAEYPRLDEEDVREALRYALRQLPGRVGHAKAA